LPCIAPRERWNGIFHPYAGGSGAPRLGGDVGGHLPDLLASIEDEIAPPRYGEAQPEHRHEDREPSQAAPA
jgi:hypothetical protein